MPSRVRHRFANAHAAVFHELIGQKFEHAAQRAIADSFHGLPPRKQAVPEQIVAGLLKHSNFILNDHPRRVDRFVFRDGRPVRGTRLVLTDLRSNPVFDENPYEFTLPDGFERSERWGP